MSRKEGRIRKHILVSAGLGFLALALWTFVANGVFGFAARLGMKPVPNEQEVYPILRQHVVDPGVYLLNPPLTPGGRFPPREPVFSVRYSDLGHDAAGRMAIMEALIFFVSAILAAWLLSMTSGRILSAYRRKVVFVVVVGLLVALSSDLAQVGIGGYPLGTALLLAMHRVGSQTFAGLAIARFMR